MPAWMSFVQATHVRNSFVERSWYDVLPVAMNCLRSGGRRDEDVSTVQVDLGRYLGTDRLAHEVERSVGVRHRTRGNLPKCRLSARRRQILRSLVRYSTHVSVSTVDKHITYSILILYTAVQKSEKTPDPPMVVHCPVS